ncbi:hypothetical protein PAPYR_10788 [Paratrimastix pyriformis]|uniref:Uncharacterized protein n=1 Tax=Paratrimastix pyriformis TaxID=342808 RepID=A0ABQ8U565_9EUKA|nr:hypothetical protein PAPYR_10788 [Paratrimastix pyriformis]
MRNFPEVAPAARRAQGLLQSLALSLREFARDFKGRAVSLELFRLLAGHREALWTLLGGAQGILPEGAATAQGQQLLLISPVEFDALQLHVTTVMRHLEGLIKYTNLFASAARIDQTALRLQVDEFKARCDQFEVRALEGTLAAIAGPLFPPQVNDHWTTLFLNFFYPPTHPPSDLDWFHATSESFLIGDLWAQASAGVLDAARASALTAALAARRDAAAGEGGDLAGLFDEALMDPEQLQQQQQQLAAGPAGSPVGGDPGTLLTPDMGLQVLRAVKERWAGLFQDVHTLRLPLAFVERHMQGVSEAAIEKELALLARTRAGADMGVLVGPLPGPLQPAGELPLSWPAWTRQRTDAVTQALRCCAMKRVAPKIKVLVQRPIIFCGAQAPHRETSRDFECKRPEC